MNNITNRDRLIELLNKAIHHALPTKIAIEPIEMVADDLLANGVIVPPCKVGDWLWVVRKDYVSQCFRVDGFDDKNLVMYMQDNEHNFSLIYKGIKIWRVSFDDFGKTVFLTKEEALAKLKELKENATQKL